MKRALRVILVAVPVLFAFVGPFLADLAPAGRQAPFGPSTWSPFGTDRLGRDVLAAALDGGRPLLLVTVTTVLCAYVVGFGLGMLAAATERPWLEDLLMRPLDVLLCLPSLLIIIVAAVRTNGSAVAIAAAVGLALVAPIARFVRMAARAVVQGPVMDALRMQGESRWHRYGRYALRELSRPVAADLGVRIAAAIYFLSSANFLGLGFDPASPDWAVSVAANKDGLATAPWSVFLPASLIVLLVLGINLLWDDLLADPRTLAVRDEMRAARRG
ncbi:ABC transporter permease [Amycolatopsis jiangsuensis]|uniref:Peptide/nickel transport system permease protein n=1 Tax=Amycolatopsis jiangsuensis TaxID=1181879 RepID=A0A840IRQ7_9PSEU|nr:ABC transporter permease subunit [Amycolatopsis jiangsuensis]MBB4684115.1 peptide/nickel transport system permease protein [Amycolatopsis jiangsuensis]